MSLERRELQELERPHRIELREGMEGKKRGLPSTWEVPIRVLHDREAGLYSGEITYEFEGIAFDHEKKPMEVAQELLDESRTGQLIRNFLCSLDAHHGLEVVFGRGIGEEWRWSFRARSERLPTSHQARDEALHLAQALRLVFGGESSRRFVARDAGEEDAMSGRMEQRVLLEPQGVVLPVPGTVPLGFASYRPETASRGVALNWPVIPRPEGSACTLAEAISVCEQPTLLGLRMQPVRLQGKDLHALREALKMLRHRECPPGTEPDGLIAGCGEQLLSTVENWLKNPRGFRMILWASSSKPLPIPFLKMLGHQVFFGPVNVREVEVPCGSLAESAPHPFHVETVLDLSGCLTEGAPLPALFPGTEWLRRSNARRLFNFHKPDFPTQGVRLGTIEEGESVEVVFPADTRDRHLYVMGATGTGKSTLLFNMILQDILAGRGLAVVDPHGDLYDQLYEAIPASRAADLVLFDPCHADGQVPGMNLLEHSGRPQSFRDGFIINELLKIFERLYDMRQCGGPMFETYFRNAMILLLESGLRETTVMELSLVFEDAGFRDHLKKRCRDSLAVNFWNNMAEKADGETKLANMAPYIISKLNALCSNRLMRLIVGQAKTSFNLRHIMDTGGILLVKLSKGLLGELNTELLGSILLTHLFGTAMERATLRADQRRPFFVYVDEFQNFVNDSGAHLMAESRKYGLHLTLANQNLAQLNAHSGRQNLLEAVIGNVGSLITFRVGPADAERLRLYSEPEFTPLQLQSLPNDHAMARILTQQGPTRPFVFKTPFRSPVPAYRKADSGDLDNGRTRHASPASATEREILSRRMSFETTSATK